MSKELFVTFPYSLHVNVQTGGVNSSYARHVEESLESLEAHGFEVYNTLREQDFMLGDDTEVVRNELSKAETCSGFIEVLSETPSRGNSTLMGIALEAGRVVMLAHSPSPPFELDQYSKNLISLGYAHDIKLPFDPEEIALHIES